MQWTFHPNDGKDGPKTCDVLCSGIWVSKSGLEEDKQFCMLVNVDKNVESVMDGKSRDNEDGAMIRQQEMLRHYPVVARQFTHDGTLMDQNPEALAAFGSPLHALPAETSVKLKKKPSESEPKSVSNNDMKGLRDGVDNLQQQENSPASTPSATNNNNGELPSTSNAEQIRQENCIDEACRAANSSHDECDFLAQFVDLDEGKQVLQAVRKGHDYSTETLQVTTEGPKWFTVNVWSIKDPVTSEPEISYSARDITNVMEAAKEEADKQNMKRDEFCKWTSSLLSF
jgi:hypothetical protein